MDGRQANQPQTEWVYEAMFFELCRIESDYSYKTIERCHI